MIALKLVAIYILAVVMFGCTALFVLLFFYDSFSWSQIALQGGVQFMLLNVIALCVRGVFKLWGYE